MHSILISLSMSIILVLSLFIIFKVSMFFWETFWIDVHYTVNNIVEVRHSSVWLSLWFVWRKICTKQKIHFVRLLMIGKGKNFIDGLIRFCVSKHLCFLGLFFFFFQIVFDFRFLLFLVFLFINSLIQNLLLKVLLNIFFDLHYNKYIYILYMTYSCG